MEKSLDKSLSLFGSWNDDIGRIIGNASSLEEVKANLNNWKDKASTSADISNLLYETLLQGDMAGQLFVRLVEVPEVQNVALSAPTPNNPFFTMSFSEALEFFESKNILSPDEFNALSAELKQLSFTATNLASDHLVSFAYKKIENFLKSGGLFKEFQRAIQREEISLGITPSDPTYLETIFRTNVADSYGSGRVKQITSPAVKAARPYVQIRNPIDHRTTNVCAWLNGKIFRTDDPGWLTYAPPNHFNCRSSAITLRNSQVDQSRVIAAHMIPAHLSPQKGFGGSKI